jgi:plasmid stabilization system protein ParE
MRIVVSPEARADLRDIFLYIAADNPAAARSLLKRIRSRITDLKDASHLGRPGRVPGTRELIIAGTPLHHSLPDQQRSAANPARLPRCRQWPESFD